MMIGKRIHINERFIVSIGNRGIDGINMIRKPVSLNLRHLIPGRRNVLKHSFTERGRQGFSGGGKIINIPQAIRFIQLPKITAGKIRFAIYGLFQLGDIHPAGIYFDLFHEDIDPVIVRGRKAPAINIQEDLHKLRTYGIVTGFVAHFVDEGIAHQRPVKAPGCKQNPVGFSRHTERLDRLAVLVHFSPRFHRNIRLRRCVTNC